MRILFRTHELATCSCPSIFSFQRTILERFKKALNTNLSPLHLQVTAQRSLSFPLLLVGLGRVELPTSPLSGVRSNHLSYRPVVSRRSSLRSITGGADRDRTGGLLNANQALSQLSYSPLCPPHAATHRASSPEAVDLRGRLDAR